MSGHSKWSTIKRKKGANDARRGKLFTKLIRELTVAARQGGAVEDSNPRLRTAVQNARAANMPQNTIDRAIRRGSGDEAGVHYEEAVYEGYGPGGVAIIIETLTDRCAQVRPGGLPGRFGGHGSARGMTVLVARDRMAAIVGRRLPAQGHPTAARRHREVPRRARHRLRRCLD